MSEIILGIESLHKCGVLYRDLKMENVLFDADGHVVLTDMGLTKLFSSKDKRRRTTSMSGTLDYMAPEVVKGVPYSFAVDWWSLGALMYELLTDKTCFKKHECETDGDVKRRILEGFNPSRLGKLKISLEAKSLILSLLHSDSEERLGSGPGDSEELKAHPFFENVDWTQVAEKKTEPAFKPQLSSELDISNFDDICTEMDAVISPADTPPECERHFKGYEYISPSVAFGRDIINIEKGGVRPAKPRARKSLQARKPRQFTQKHKAGKRQTDQQEVVPVAPCSSEGYFTNTSEDNDGRRSANPRAHEILEAKNKPRQFTEKHTVATENTRSDQEEVVPVAGSEGNFTSPSKPGSIMKTWRKRLLDQYLDTNENEEDCRCSTNYTSHKSSAAKYKPRQFEEERKPAKRRRDTQEAVAACTFEGYFTSASEDKEKSPEREAKRPKVIVVYNKF